MFARLALLFLVVPLVELGLLLLLADYTDWKLALLLVIVTGLSGAWLVRHQGWRAMRKIQGELRDGHLPGDSLMDAVLVLVAGVLLLTPGILTDLVAISLLIPWTRILVKRRLLAWAKARFSLRSVMAANPDGGAATTDPDTFDATARRI